MVTFRNVHLAPLATSLACDGPGRHWESTAPGRQGEGRGTRLERPWNGLGPGPPRNRPPSALGTTAGAGAAVDPTPPSSAASGVPIGTTSPGGTRSRIFRVETANPSWPRAPSEGYPGRPGQNPDAHSDCQPTNRAPPGTREALVGRRGSPVASLALGRVIGQWGHRASHRGGGTPGRLATRPRQYALCALSWR